MSLGRVTRAKDAIQQKRVSHRPWAPPETVLLVGLTQGSVMKHGAPHTRPHQNLRWQLVFSTVGAGERLPACYHGGAPQGSHHSGPLG